MRAELLSTTEIQNYSHCMVIVPLGAFEQHGPYLPLATDTMIATALAERAEQQDVQGIMLFPTIWVGASVEHAGFPGTLSLAGPTLISLLTDLFSWLESSGFTRVVLYNAHGGNIHAAAVAAEEYSRPHLLKIKNFYAYTDKVKAAAKQLFGVAETHGGSTESSLVAALRPDLALVDGERENNHPYRGGGLLNLYETRELSQDGVLDGGEKIIIRKEYGEELAGLMVEELLGQLQGFAIPSH